MHTQNQIGTREFDNAEIVSPNTSSVNQRMRIDHL